MHKRKVKRDIVFAAYADFCLGMATAWGFAAWESLSRLAWGDLFTACLFATITLRASIAIKPRIAYDKLS